MAKNTSGAWDPTSAKTVRQLNTSFRMEESKPYHMQILSPIFEDPSRVNKDAKGKDKMAAPSVMRVRDLTDGRELDIIVASIPQTRLEENYPAASYVGACFRIVQLPKRATKRYRDYEIDEIDGSESDHFQSVKDVLANAKNYGPRDSKKAKSAKG